jgi:hypothetical protein
MVLDYLKPELKNDYVPIRFLFPQLFCLSEEFTNADWENFIESCHDLYIPKYLRKIDVDEALSTLKYVFSSVRNWVFNYKLLDHTTVFNNIEINSGVTMVRSLIGSLAFSHQFLLYNMQKFNIINPKLFTYPLSCSITHLVIDGKKILCQQILTSSFDLIHRDFSNDLMQNLNIPEQETLQEWALKGSEQTSTLYLHDYMKLKKKNKLPLKDVCFTFKHCSFCELVLECEKSNELILLNTYLLTNTINNKHYLLETKNSKTQTIQITFLQKQKLCQIFHMLNGKKMCFKKAENSGLDLIGEPFDFIGGKLESFYFCVCPGFISWNDY